MGAKKRKQQQQRRGASSARAFWEAGTWVVSLPQSGLSVRIRRLSEMDLLAGAGRIQLGLTGAGEDELAAWQEQLAALRQQTREGEEAQRERAAKELLRIYDEERRLVTQKIISGVVEPRITDDPAVDPQQHPEIMDDPTETRVHISLIPERDKLFLSTVLDAYSYGFDGINPEAGFAAVKEVTERVLRGFFRQGKLPEDGGPDGTVLRGAGDGYPGPDAAAVHPELLDHASDGAGQ